MTIKFCFQPALRLRSLSTALLCSIVALAACGGGGGDAGNPPFSNGGGTEKAAALTLNLSAASIKNSGVDEVTATATATDSGSRVLAGVEVAFSVDDAELVVASGVTDSNGKATATVRVGDNRANRFVVVTAKANAGALSRVKTIQVTGAELVGTPKDASLTAGQASEVEYKLVDDTNVAMSGYKIVVAGPGGAEVEGVTDTLGKYIFPFTAPSTTGTLKIRATAAGSPETTTDVEILPAGGFIPPVDAVLQPVVSASISANPSVVPVNLPLAQDVKESEVRALFLTNSNAPIKNLRVRFDRDGDVNSIPGTIGTAGSLYLTNSNGVATASYVPGDRASPTDGVTVRACWDYADFAAGACPHSVKTTLTVTADPVSVSIGTNSVIIEGASGLTYVKRYVVQVVDSSGFAKEGVQITPSIDLLRYFKGEYFIPADTWLQSALATCENEDINRNNTNDVYPPSAANPAFPAGAPEDVNGSFNLTPGRPALEPRKADVSISVEGSNKSDSSGIVVVRIEYPQNIASWVEFNILVAASNVSATEGRANYRGVLPVLATVLKNKDVDPPFRYSPYGTGASPVVLVTSPEGKSAQLCTNPN
jgi:hypothetical protein